MTYCPDWYDPDIGVDESSSSAPTPTTTASA